MRRAELKKLIELMDAVGNGMREIASGNLSDRAAGQIIEESNAAFEIMKEAAASGFSQQRSKGYTDLIGRIQENIQAAGDLLSDGGKSRWCQAECRDIKGEGDKSMHSIETLETVRKADGINTIMNRIRSGIDELRSRMQAEQEIQYIIVFLPYKASMWDAMESIWMTAKKDRRCTAYVMPIPYFDRNPDHSFGTMHYEIDKMPDYVDTIDCRQLDLGQLHPDVIYFHNPYDQYNFVTSVHPQFYSKELKNCTDLLVFTPYFIPGAYQSAESAQGSFQTMGMLNADLIIAQSDVHKALMAANGNTPGKIAVLGNPKLDYVQNHLGDCIIPDEWTQIMNGKKVFLLCSSIGAFLSVEKILELYEVFIDQLIHTYHAVVIYRPHPLLEATVRSMRPQRHGEYMRFLNKYCSCGSFIYDDREDVMPSVCASDCMISDYSSLCFSYAVTGKPAAMTIGTDAPAEDLYYAFDYRGMDFINFSDYTNKGQIPQSFQRFAEDVINGRDRGKERRMKLLEQSVVHLDEGCGDKIHEYVMKLLP